MIGTAGRRDRHAQALQIFDAERDVLLNGPIAGLAGLVARREAMLAEILADAEPAPEAFLAALKAKAERNSRLLLASLAGLSAARERIAEAEREATSLRTYTAAGTAVQVSASPKTRDHRR